MATSQLQLDPPFWIQTPKGEGFALIHIDYGMTENGVFLVHLHETGELLYVDMKECRGVENHTYGIECPEKPKRYYNNKK
jgi:hypothetical protein